jgi:hypothetical protein
VTMPAVATAPGPGEAEPGQRERAGQDEPAAT